MIEKIKSHPLSKYVLISLLAHLVLLIVFYVGPKLFSFKRKPQRVVWIQLPQGIGNDIEAIRKAENLPRSSIQEQKQAEKMPEAPETDTLKQKPSDLPEQKPEEKTEEKKEPEQTPPPPAEPPKPEEPKPETIKIQEKEPEKPVEKKEEPKPEKPVEKKEEKPAPKTTPTTQPKKATSAIDRKIQEALSKNKDKVNQKVPVEASQVPDGGKGAGSRTAQMDARMQDPIFAQYYALIRERINREWITTPKLFNEGESLRSQIVVTIAEDGTINSIEFEESSGNYSFDLSAKRAVERSSPLPPPPDQLKEEIVEEGFLIEFSPTKVER